MLALVFTLALLQIVCHQPDPQQEDSLDGENKKSFQTERFMFETGGNNLVGLLDRPIDRDPAATIIIVHGYGQTKVVEQNWYYELRSQFAHLSINVLVWDKPGCGDSEGEFDINQPVESSADEVIAAIHAL